MSKTNKELAIDVAIAAINSNPKTVSNNNSVSPGLSTQSILNIINSVYTTLENFDKQKDEE